MAERVSIAAVSLDYPLQTVVGHTPERRERLCTEPFQVREENLPGEQTAAIHRRIAVGVWRVGDLQVGAGVG